MGQGSFINTNCFLDMGSDIVIGKNVSIAMGCSLINSTHKIGPENKRAAEDIKQTIIIEDGVWLGCNVTVLPGLKIGHGSIIAVGSVVIRDCDSNCLYAGVPAKKIRVLSNDLTTQ